MQDYKVIFIGRSGVGKTTAINSVSEISPVSTEVLATDSSCPGKEKTTVAFDYGEVTIPGGINRMRLYGAPGQQRFSFMWDILDRSSTGFILLVDNTLPDALDDTRAYLKAHKDKLTGSHAVALVGIVKYDLSPSPDIECYRQLLWDEGFTFEAAVLDARCADSVLLLLKILFRRLERQRNNEVMKK
jgi:hypothetical protein